MTQQIINIGSIANDGTGDTMRNAFGKVDNNFSEVYTSIANVASNLNNLIVSIDTFEGDIYDMTVSAFIASNNAGINANNAYNIANLTFAIANTANGASANSANAYNLANSFSLKINTNFTVTNSAYNVANAAFNFANALPLGAAAALATAGFDRANVAFILAGEAYDMANAGVILAIGAEANAESAYNFSNAVSVNATASFRTTNSAYRVVNSAYEVTNSVYYMSNSSYVVANAAFGRANSKINTVNGVATGLFTVQGNQSVTGNVSISGPNKRFDFIDGVIYIDGIPFDPTPAGAVIYMARAVVPNGYLYANGQAVSRFQYSKLFTAIATTFGAGDGSTTFNLPDLRGEFIRGWDDSRGIDSGRAFGTVQTSDVSSHTHTYRDLYTFEDDYPGAITPIYDIYGNRIDYYIDDTGNNGGDYLHMNYDEDGDRQPIYYTGRTDNTGGTETRPRNVSLYPCIKY